MILTLNNASDVNAQSLKKLEKLVSKENTVILNHATWCGHCHMFRPQWEQFKTNQPFGKQLNIVEVESSALEQIKQNQKLYKRVVPKDGMVYFPMIVVFVKKENKASDKKIYEGSRNSEDLKKYLEGKIVATKATVKKSKKTTTASKGKSTSASKTRGAGTKSSASAATANLQESAGSSYRSLFDLNKELDSVISQMRNMEY
jgi:thiol-disulfide isomerase/thioredoxin